MCAYVVKRREMEAVEYRLIATGSEVELALEVANELGEGVRVVSMPSWELFEKQPKATKKPCLRVK